jgi:hypothetical protein
MEFILGKTQKKINKGLVDTSQFITNHNSLDVVMEVKAVDIYGCSLPQRECTTHKEKMCGDGLKVDDAVIFQYDVEEEDGTLVERMNAYTVKRGAQCCLVGHLPLRLLKNRHKFEGKMALVVEDLRLSDSKSKRSRSEFHGGIVKAKLIESIQLSCRAT